VSTWIWIILSRRQWRSWEIPIISRQGELLPGPIQRSQVH
jgi:hypothetical protein